ncbi:MAG: Fe-S cluster assembly protein IscX [Chloroflexi bacterium]|jgi:FeS assembly protein IscX|nr:MAG: hypothetical protein UZ13_00749 [Chloroflexi bacterium OLB13]MBC6956634.1 Fe-S assembly protein IscX [Chloroflexota bacterium]MBV6435834.1 Protein IscX [Anaerolineae bacterium]MDL1915966.1 Fe-S cluster assembly protein IscX [Anaerolineae bacterium CFX4]OQY83278.1 MAG: Fe-S assembly protein IscX [Anaerolineae bacterium UTCFX5]
MLTWDASYEIALALREAHPDVDLERVGIEQLEQWVIALPDFSDDPAMANQGLLEAILRDWYEESSGV